MNRRTFLAGMSTAFGATLLSPWAKQALAAPSETRRFVFVVEGNGFDPRELMSKAARSAIDAYIPINEDEKSPGYLLPISTGLRAFPRLYGHDSTLVVQDEDLGTAPGLAYLGDDLIPHASVTLGLSSTITGGSHSTHCGALSSTRSQPGQPGGQTIDDRIAKHLRDGLYTPFEAVRVGIHADDNHFNYGTCAYGMGRPAPCIMSPQMAYQNLFGSVSQDRSTFARRGRLLDYALEDVKVAKMKFSGNSAERQKLETYLESIEALQERQDWLSNESNRTPITKAAEGIYGDPFSDDPIAKLDYQFQLVKAALLGGLTNVAVIGAGTGELFAGLTYPTQPVPDVNRHVLQHGAKDSAEYLATLQGVWRSHIGMIGDLARGLNDADMLENTVIVYLPDNGERHHSEAIEFPVLMVGGQGMGLKNDGRTTVFPGMSNSGHRQLSNLYNTLGHAAGLELNDFGAEGDGQRMAEGPLSELRS